MNIFAKYSQNEEEKHKRVSNNQKDIDKSEDRGGRYGVLDIISKLTLTLLGVVMIQLYQKMSLFSKYLWAKYYNVYSFQLIELIYAHTHAHISSHLSID